MVRLTVQDWAAPGPDAEVFAKLTWCVAILRGSDAIGWFVTGCDLYTAAMLVAWIVSDGDGADVEFGPAGWPRSVGGLRMVYA